MNRVQAFFLEEAADCLVLLARPRPLEADDVGPLHAAARRLRGNAQLAQYGAVSRVALRLERRLKPVARGAADWTPATARAVAEDIEALTAAVEAVREGRVEREPPVSREEDTMENHEVEGAEEVAIEELEYRGRPALARALEIRTGLEDAIAADEPVGPILDELFDLIRMGME